MRLAFLVLDGGLGGHTRTAASVAEGMISRGHEVQLLLGTASKEDVVKKANVPFLKIEHGLTTQLITTLDAFRPDAIHTFSTLGLAEAVAYGKAHNVPIVYTRCGGPPVKEPLEVWMMKALGLRRLTCLSEENREELREKSKAKVEDIQVLPARIDVAAMRKRQDPAKWKLFRERLAIPADHGVLLRIARIGPAYEETIRLGIDVAERLNAEGIPMTFVHIGFADVPKIAEGIYERVAEANRKAGKIIAVSDAEVSLDAQAHVAMGDAVMGMGRAAFEGMAVQRPTLIVGKVGFGGLVLPETVERLAKYNFSGRDGGAPLTRDESLERICATVKRLLLEEDYRKIAGEFAGSNAENHLDVRLSLEAYETLYRDKNPAQWPSDSEIRRAMLFAVVKRGLRNAIPKSLRAQVSGILNLRNKPAAKTPGATE